MMERRDFVRTLGAAALGPVLQPRAPSPYPRAPLRKLDRIGLQLYTVRHEMQKDVEGTIARVAAIGYREVEFAGYFGKSPRDVRALLDHHGLSAPSSHVSLVPDQWRAALEIVARTDRWLGLSMTRASCPFSTSTRSPT